MYGHNKGPLLGSLPPILFWEIQEWPKQANLRLVKKTRFSTTI